MQSEIRYVAGARRDPLTKGLMLLKWLFEEARGSVGVSEAAAALDLPAPSTHRLLSALCDSGLVERTEEDGRYRLSLELFRLARKVADRTPIREIALPHLRELVDACHETAFLSLYDRSRQEMMMITSVESPHPLRYFIELNRWLPVYVGATGLSIMAFLPEAERQAITARTRLAALTDRTITDRYRLEAEIEKIQAKGYACSHGQRVQGVVGLAVPLFDINGEVIGNIGVTMPEQRFQPSNEPDLARLVKTCVARVSARMHAERQGSKVAV